MSNKVNYENNATKQDAGLHSHVLSNVRSMNQSSDEGCNLLTVWNEEAVRWQIINKAVANLTQQTGVTYDDKCLSNRQEMKVVKVQGIKYNVTICCKPIECSTVLIATARPIRHKVINQGLLQMMRSRGFLTMFGDDCVPRSDQIKVFKIRENQFKIKICCSPIFRMVF